MPSDEEKELQETIARLAAAQHRSLAEKVIEMFDGDAPWEQYVRAFAGQQIALTETLNMVGMELMPWQLFPYFQRAIMTDKMLLSQLAQLDKEHIEVLRNSLPGDDDD